MGADPDSVLLCQRLPPLVVTMTMFYTRPCSTPTSLPNKDYIGTKGKRVYQGMMLWGSGAVYQWDTTACSHVLHGALVMWMDPKASQRSRSSRIPLWFIPCPCTANLVGTHRGTRGHPEQHCCKSRARLWGWHKGGCLAP